MCSCGVTPDVDECEMGNAGCAQNCSNTNGSFVCSCGVGYVLADDDLDRCNFSSIFLLLCVLVMFHCLNII